MAKDNCLLCASDEGLFLDLEQQPSLKTKADNCRLRKISEAPTSTICHKCAFELDQCNTFVEKVKKASSQDLTSSCCILCASPQNDKIYFNLGKQDQGLNDLIEQICELFVELREKELKKESICLSCRYCIDLLTDLRTLSDEITGKLKRVIKNGINPADLPKTKTIIVNRKTTLTQATNFDLNTPSDTGSDTSEMSSRRKNKTKSSVTKSRQSRQSSQEPKVTSKSPTKNSPKKRKKFDYPETKPCFVLLKDIFDESNEKEFKIEKLRNGKIKYVILKTKKSDKKKNSFLIKKTNTVEKQEEEEDEENSDIEKNIARNRSKRSKKNAKGSKSKTAKSNNRTRKESEVSEESEESIQDISIEKESDKDVGSSIEEEDDDEIKPLRNNQKKQKVTRRTKKESEQSNQDIKPVRASNRRKKVSETIADETEPKSTRSTRKRKESESSVIQEIASKPTSSRRRKDSEQSEQRNVEVKNLRITRRRKDSEQSVQDTNTDVDSDSGPVLKKSKKSNLNTELEKNQLKKDSNQKRRKRGRSSSVESSSSLRMSTRNAKKNTINNLEEIIEIDDSIENENSDKETLSENEDLPKPKKKCIDKSKLDDEQSGAESTESTTKPRSKRSSSKESVSSRQSARSVRIDEEIAKKAVAKSSKLKNTDEAPKLSENSESEEIDILKSTDEETKDDTLNADNDKINQSQVEKPNKILEENLENSQSQENCRSEVKETSNDNIVENIKIANNEKDDEKNDPSTSSMLKNVTEKEDEGNDSDSSKKSKISSRRSSLNSTRSSKSQNKQSKNKGNNLIIYDLSDSESTKESKKQIDNSYTCAICDQFFENKLIGLKHELLHMKMLKIKLHRVVIPEKTVNTIKSTEEPQENMEVSEEEENENLEKTLDDKNEDQMSVDENEMDKEQNDENEERSHNDEDCVMSEPQVDKIDNQENGTDTNVGEVEENNISDKSDIAAKENQNENNETDRNRRSPRRQKTVGEKKSRVLRGKNKNLDENNSDEEISTVVDSDSEKIVEADEETQNERSKDNQEVVEENESEKEASTAVDSDTEKIAEAVQETLNDMAELHEKVQKEATIVETEVEDISEKSENNEDKAEEEEEIETIDDETPVSNENDENDKGIVEEESDVQSDVEKDESNRNESPRDDPEIIECETLDDDKEEEIEYVKATPIVDIDESSKDVVDVEKEAEQRQDENDVEITEIDDTEPDERPASTECENIDLTGKDESHPEDDSEIEEIVNPQNNIQMDENTVDSITEINVTASEEPCVENNEGNPKKRSNNVAEQNNEEEENTTEDEEALAQQSLEELLKRKGLQVVDEFAESVTDGDEESEKEVNASLDKDNNVSAKDSELEIKISDAECTEILEISGKSSSKQKAADNVVGESQIIQDVDVVEEVVNDDDEPTQNDDVQEVEVESNGNCLDVVNSVGNRIPAENYNSSIHDVAKRLELETEPISDDESELITEPVENVTRELRKSQDMPSLDPIGDEYYDE